MTEETVPVAELFVSVATARLVFLAMMLLIAIAVIDMISR